MYSISKTFSFEAAHHLPSLPPEHKCSRVHGHSYTVTVTVAGSDLHGPGWVMDFAGLNPLGDYLARVVDHRDLNEVLDFEPTSERLARYLHDWCTAGIRLPAGARVESVRVSEKASSTFVEYRPGAAS
ncbi:MAG: 6-carboxytetrahydropterin synthase [Nocardiopsaceae bacterium]|nr:6-carboxytetrahydropterin synthase [Nocardiopsaceae bacterium]